MTHIFFHLSPPIPPSPSTPSHPLLSPAEDVTEGNVEVKVYFNKSPIVDLTFDLCGILNELFSLTCPIKAGVDLR